jgi:hypothetical protein
MRKNASAFFARWVSRLWPVTLAGLIIGAAIGGWAMLGGGESQATALMRIYPPVDPDQIMTGAAPDPDSQQSYISGEITYLTSPGFAEAVQRQLSETEPPQLSAVQDARSSIVSLSATQPTYAQAQRIVDGALKAYGDHAQQQVRERGQAAIDAIDAVAARLSSETTQGEVADPTAQSESSPSPDAVQARLQQLDLQRLAIETQMQRPAAVQIVQPTMEAPVAGVPGWSLGAVGGALGGGLITLAAAYAWRKRAGVVIAQADALTGQIQRVLTPTVRLGGLTESSDAYAGLARSLYTQLPTPRTGRLLIVGASADSGSDEIARLIAFAIAEHRQVDVGYLAQDALPVDSSHAFADQEDGPSAVIDGGSIDTSPALLAAAEDASQIIVVVGIGRDYIEAVQVASQLTDRCDIPVSAVCTQGGSRRAGSSRRENKPSIDEAGGTPVNGQAVADGSRRDNGDSQHSFDGFVVTK